MGVRPVARLLPTHRTTQTQNKATQTSMPRVGFETTIALLSRAKTVNTLDGAATVIVKYSGLVRYNGFVLLLKALNCRMMHTLKCHWIENI
jgi:hypothetical protein